MKVALRIGAELSEINQIACDIFSGVLAANPTALIVIMGPIVGMQIRR